MKTRGGKVRGNENGRGGGAPDATRRKKTAAWVKSQVRRSGPTVEETLEKYEMQQRNLTQRKKCQFVSSKRTEGSRD